MNIIRVWLGLSQLVYAFIVSRNVSVMHTTGTNAHICRVRLPPSNLSSLITPWVHVWSGIDLGNWLCLSVHLSGFCPVKSKQALIWTQADLMSMSWDSLRTSWQAL